MEYDDVVTTRRSLHEYSDEELTDETLAEIFERVRYSPSSYNLQPWEFLVVREEDTRERLREVAYDQAHVTDAPAVAVVLGNTDPAAHGEAVAADMRRKGYLPDEEAEAGLLDTFAGMRERSAEERRVWTVTSTTLAARALMDAAWAEGVASCPVGGFDADALVEAFDVEAGYEPVMLVTLGYPAEDADELDAPRKYRRPVSEFVHLEEFDPVDASSLPEERVTETREVPADD